MNNNQIKNLLKDYPQLKKDLFIRGFLISSEQINDLNSFPFYGNWKHFSFDGFSFYWHNKTNFYYFENDKTLYFLFGHAYNPLTLEVDEQQILKSLSTCKDICSFNEKVYDLTGIFLIGKVSNNNIDFTLDPAGLQSCFCGNIHKSFYLSSHAQLIADLCELERDSFVDKLIKYKWYGRILGPYLPGDVSPFSELKRVISGFNYSFDFHQINFTRFWPIKKHNKDYSSWDYDKKIKDASDILSNSFKCICNKWNKPNISLTGGIDSNTTFAAANGFYDKIESFSYVSTDKEVPDAKSAKLIADKFKVNHKQFDIPKNNSEIELFDQRKELFLHNNGYIAQLKDYELRKKLYLHDNCEISLEIKSWVSESIRCYWYKYYNRKKLPALSYKLYRNLYKIFILNRKLAHKIDFIYKDYLQKYYKDVSDEILPADLNYHEIGWGSWGSLNISEMKYCFEITSIFNNRRFLDLMYSVPFDKRLNDQHHLDIKKLLNKELYDMGIRVKNVKETKFRSFVLNVLFSINTILPF